MNLFNHFKRKKQKGGINTLMPKSFTPEYWNNHWDKAPIIYSGRALRTKNDRIGIDVKTFLKKDDQIIKETIKRYRLDRDRTADDIAHTIQRFVVKSMTYKYDEDNVNVPEFWQFPFESLQSGVGDCEDGAILTASLLINAGIPSWRVKVAAGYVQSSPTAPQGGHAYCIYLADDGNWKILDWCYFEDSHLPISKKPLAKEGGYKGAYKDVWFTFNDEYSWNQSSLEIREGRISEHQTKKLEETVEQSELTLNSIMEKLHKRL